MHAIIRIRPKTGATNEVSGIVASEPPGLKLRKQLSEYFEQHQLPVTKGCGIACNI